MSDTRSDRARNWLAPLSVVLSAALFLWFLPEIDGDRPIDDRALGRLVGRNPGTEPGSSVGCTFVNLLGGITFSNCNASKKDRICVSCLLEDITAPLLQGSLAETGVEQQEQKSWCSALEKSVGVCQQDMMSGLWRCTEIVTNGFCDAPLWTVVDQNKAGN